MSTENHQLKQWHSGKKTLLLAEDDEGARTLTRRILEDAGYAVIVTDNGYSALAILQEFGDCIDLLLLDMTMPVMDGDWVLREMRNRRHLVPVIIYSGLAEEEIRRRCNGCAYVGILTKPSRSKEILVMVSAVLSDAEEGAAFPGVGGSRPGETQQGGKRDERA